MNAPDISWAKPYGTVVFDLDGVLATPTWPLRGIVGDPIPEGLELLRHYANQGFCIWIHTARRETDKPAIWEWVKRHRLPVDVVLCGKPMAALYVDDRAYQPEWVEEYRG